jgi:hypothetical protein
MPSRLRVLYSLLMVALLSNPALTIVRELIRPSDHWWTQRRWPPPFRGVRIESRSMSMASHSRNCWQGTNCGSKLILGHDQSRLRRFASGSTTLTGFERGDFHSF